MCLRGGIFGCPKGDFAAQTKKEEKRGKKRKEE
jgi:hypothetical protein